jgi:oligoendopeptidase F
MKMKDRTVSHVDFREYEQSTPTYEVMAAQHEQLASAVDAATSGDEAIAAVEKWDALRRHIATWSGLVSIRFSQDTRNEDFKKAREYRDELEPKLTSLAVAMKRRLLQSPHRNALATRFGSHVFDLWRCDIASFDPVIEADLARQSKLEADYTALLASAKFDFQGESLTLAELAKFDEHPARDVRHDAARLRWVWFGENREQLDNVFDELVQLRQSMKSSATTISSSLAIYGCGASTMVSAT